MKKVLPIIALVITAAVASYFLVFRSNPPTTNSSSTSEPTSSQDDDTASVGTDAGDSKKFTLSEVSEHNTAGDCWTIINDKVYNLTSYISRHPGGDDILRACGTDGTTLFETRTTADGETVGGGGSHSSSAEAALNELRIGSLKE